MWPSDSTGRSDWFWGPSWAALELTLISMGGGTMLAELMAAHHSGCEESSACSMAYVVNIHVGWNQSMYDSAFIVKLIVSAATTTI